MAASVWLISLAAVKAALRTPVMKEPCLLHIHSVRKRHLFISVAGSLWLLKLSAFHLLRSLELFCDDVAVCVVLCEVV